MINEVKEIGCWNCALDGVKSGKPVCPDCGTEIAHHCKEYSHEEIYGIRIKLKEKNNHE